MEYSAGLLPYAWRDGRLVVFLVHMGAPLWARRDEGAWSIAKGLYVPGVEEPADAARREFAEEVGVQPPVGSLLDLGEVHTRPGKVVRVFAVRSDPGLAFVRSGTFTLVWPPHSGRVVSFPEVDRAEWFLLPDAEVKLVPGQVPFLEALVATVRKRPSETTQAPQEPHGDEGRHRAGEDSPGQVGRHDEHGEVAEDGS